MAASIKKQGWIELTDVVTTSIEEVSDFQPVTNDDGSYKAKQLTHHILLIPNSMITLVPQLACGYTGRFYNIHYPLH
jgi:hypothetical protein